MNLKFNIFNILILFGTFQGITLFVLLNTLRRSKRNFFLSLLLLAFSLNTLKMMLFDIGFFNHYPILHFFPFFFFLIGPSLYFYTKCLTGNTNFSIFEYSIHFLLFGVNFLYYIACLIIGNDTIQQFHENIYRNFEELFSLISVGIYIAVTLRILNRYHQSIKGRYSDVTPYKVSWLKNLLTATFGGWLMWFLFYILNISIGYFNPQNGAADYYPIYIYMSFFIYWIGYSGYVRSEFKPLNLDMNIQNLANRIDLTAEDRQLLHKICEIVKNEKLYTKKGLKIEDLAKRFEIRSTHLSLLLNQGLKKNFYDFINELRIEEFKRLLRDNGNNYLTIQSLAEASGFTARSTYNDLFKKYTNMTPNAYKMRYQV